MAGCRGQREGGEEKKGGTERKEKDGGERGYFFDQAEGALWVMVQMLRRETPLTPAHKLVPVLASKLLP